jgi:DNA-binding response OmpR family regulator
MSSALLIAEPESTTRGFLERHLRQDGFNVVEAHDGEALELAERARPDLVLASDALALELCRRVRDVPVIVLGRPDSDAVDRVRALAGGCDDYVGRPFHYEELLARIRAVLRRVSPPERDRIEVGDLLIDRAARRVLVRGVPVILAAKEYDLLVKLACDPSRVFTKEELLREVWGFRSLGSKRCLRPSRSCCLAAGDRRQPRREPPAWNGLRRKVEFPGQRTLARRGDRSDSHRELFRKDASAGADAEAIREAEG